MGGNIDCYLDLSSFYSYITLVYLQKNREALASHNVTVNFIPIFLGGVNVGSGNKPPWSLPAKAAYGQFDSARAKKYHNLEKIEVPDFFPPLTILPQRALCYIKATYPPSTFEATWLALFEAMWTAPHSNITLQGPLTTTLSSLPFFTPSSVATILASASSQPYKDLLTANTQKVVDLGGFGAPWMMVRNGEGKEEPFFGSDRWHFMWEFLGLPWLDVRLLRKGEKAKL